MTTDNAVYAAIALLISLISAALIMAWLERLKVTMSARQIIGSSKAKNDSTDFIYSLLSKVNFNKDEIRKNFVSAGIYNNFIIDTYYLFKIVPFVLCSIVIASDYIMEKSGLVMSLSYLLIALFVFVVGPDMYIAGKGKQNIKRMSNRLPFLLDLMNVCVHSGMTVESSLDYLSEELETIDKSLAYVIKATVDRSKLVGIEDALEEFYELIPTSEAQSFVMTIKQSLQFGSSIGPTLKTLASDIREINMMDLEEKIGKMGAKMAIPMIAFIMVPIVVLIAAPGIMRMLV